MTSSSSTTQLSTTISSSPSSTSSIPLAPSSSLNAHHTGGHITCVVIGDCGVGKSSLVVSYTTNGFPNQYVPTAFDNYSVDVSVGTRLVHFDICDTGGKVNSKTTTTMITFSSTNINGMIMTVVYKEREPNPFRIDIIIDLCEDESMCECDSLLLFLFRLSFGKSAANVSIEYLYNFL